MPGPRPESPLPVQDVPLLELERSIPVVAEGGDLVGIDLAGRGQEATQLVEGEDVVPTRSDQHGVGAV